MKLLVVMDGLGSGGAQKSLIAFLDTLKKYKSDIEVDFYALRPEGMYVSQIPSYCNWIYKPAEGIMMNYPLSKQMFWKHFTLKGFIGKIYHLIKKKFTKEKTLDGVQALWSHWERFIPSLPMEYDVAISYMHGLSNYFVVSKCNAKKKYVYIHHEYAKLNTNADFDYEYFSKTDGVITVSDRCVESVLSIIPQLRGKVYSIENISSSSQIRSQAKEFSPVEYGEDREQLRLCSVGRLSEVKRFDRAIETARVLRDRKIDFKWLIVGDGELHQKLSDMIKNYNLDENVMLVGLKMNPYPYIGQADVFVQTSDNEGKSIVLDEAKILGKPIVVTNYQTAKDAVDNGSTGIICDFSPSALADAIISLNHSALYNEIVRNLQSTDYSNEKEIVKYFDLWEKA